MMFLNKIKNSIEEKKGFFRTLTPKFGDFLSRLCAPSPTDEQPQANDSLSVGKGQFQCGNQKVNSR